MAVNIEVLEPIVDGSIVYQQIAPPGLGKPMQCRISILMRLHNPDAAPIAVTKLTLEIGTATHTLHTFSPAKVIDPNDSYPFQNCSDTKYPGAKPLVIDLPSQSIATIAVHVEGSATPVQKQVSIRAHTNRRGPLRFPAKASDLRPNETWGASSAHLSDHQVFALDIGVRGWDGGTWSERFPGTDEALKESFRTYGMPLYAMADGAVCWALNDHEERKLIGDNAGATTKSPSLGAFVDGGNQIFLKTRDEIHVYAHLQPASIPPEFLVIGARVGRGRYLGKAGLSGSTGAPAPHIHVKKEPASGAPDTTASMNRCDDGYFRPMAFTELQSLTESEALSKAADGTLNPGDWTPLTNHSAPNPYGYLYPATAGIGLTRVPSDVNQYTAAWSGADRIQLLVKRSGWPSFTAKWDELSKDGFRLAKVETCLEGTTRQFIGIFERGGGNHGLWLGAGWNAFKAAYDDLTRNGGVRLVDLATYLEGGQRYYLAAYRAGQDRFDLQPITGWEAFNQKWADLTEQHLRLVGLEIHPDGNDQRYIGIFREGQDAHALLSITGWEAFTSLWNEASQDGLRLIDTESFAVAGSRQFVAVFRAGGGGYVLESVTGFERFVQSCEKNNAIGLRLDDVHVEP